jgi:hypothetical protein
MVAYASRGGIHKLILPAGVVSPDSTQTFGNGDLDEQSSGATRSDEIGWGKLNGTRPVCRGLTSICATEPGSVAERSYFTFAIEDARILNRLRKPGDGSSRDHLAQVGDRRSVRCRICGETFGNMMVWAITDASSPSRLAAVLDSDRVVVGPPSIAADRTVVSVNAVDPTARRGATNDYAVFLVVSDSCARIRNEGFETRSKSCAIYSSRQQTCKCGKCRVRHLVAANRLQNDVFDNAPAVHAGSESSISMVR